MNTIPFSNVLAYYASSQPNGSWFSPGNRRFFGTKLPRVAYQGLADTLFVTAETNPSNETRYSVRMQRRDGGIDTVGEFHSFKTRADAVAEIKRLMMQAAPV